MISPRAMHTATALLNGKVLIAVGFGWEGPVNTAEIYDPVSGAFILTAGDLTAERYNQTATLLPNGKVLVAGGSSPSGPLASAETFDPATGTFSATAPMGFARYNHSASLVGDKVLVAGGFNDIAVLSSAELFNPVTGSFSPTGPLTHARISHTAAIVSGKSIILGGLGPLPLVQAEIFDSASNSFGLTGSMLTARYLTTATTLLNGKVLVAGGYNAGPLASAELYNPASLPPAVPTITFTVNSPQINQGQSATLSWDSTNATTVTINGAAVPVDGTLVVTPSATTTYNLTATGPGGSAQASVTVTVIIPPPVPTVTFTANNLQINQGQSASLTWDSTNAVTVTINGASMPVDGTMIVSPVATTTYLLHAAGQGGSVQASLAVAVILAVVIDVKPGDSVNTINSKSKGKIPVAILSSASFDASTKVNVSTLTFGHSGNEASLAFCAIQQVNADGLMDLMCHFDTETAAFLATDTVAILKGKTTAGVAFQSTDSVRIVK